MSYEFMGKIKNAQNDKLLDMTALAEHIEKIKTKAAKSIEVRVILSEKQPRRDLLVKSKIFVTSMAGQHMDDLYAAINLFKFYLEEIAKDVLGEVSKSEGFYNNDKTYSSLY